MKILILGGTGMLGHRLWIHLRREHEVWVTVREDHNPFPNMLEFPEEYIHYGVDGLVIDEVARAITSIQPDVVINCIGVIKQLETARDPVLSISLNSLFPHKVAAICLAAKIRMIHISTDCVFSGKRGRYVESDISDAEDLYGRSKFLGEVQYPHTITLRTSIIGQELKTRLGLIEWFLMQMGTIHGFQNAIFSGFTTIELSNLIINYVLTQPEINGLYHVSSDPISKYDLLQLAKRAYQKEIEIQPDQDFFCDRSLDSSHFRQDTGYQPPSWPEMIDKMADQATFYNQIRAYFPNPRG
jgi:dTDP-4-dehydrorhamnose reductase